MDKMVIGATLQGNPAWFTIEKISRRILVTSVVS